jgi:hypothetical protein
MWLQAYEEEGYMKTFVKVIYEEAVNMLSLHIHRF